MNLKWEAIMVKNKAGVMKTLKIAIKNHIFLTLLTLVFVVAAVMSSLLPPLVLGNVVDTLTLGNTPELWMIFLYFVSLLLEGVCSSLQDSFLILYGQKMIRYLREEMSRKMSRLPASTLVEQKPGEVLARFSSDVDAVESLFSSGVISMVADFSKIISIFVIICIKNLGLALVLLIVIPLLTLFTRYIQKKTLVSQLENRKAIAKVSGQVPESIHNIRAIHLLGLEKYMENRYDKGIEESYKAVEKTNFFDSIYSPVVVIVNALVVGLVMILSASGNANVLALFGMSVGTSVTVISYITKIFSPIESLGMEIQTIQGAMAGVKRIDSFLKQDERSIPSGEDGDGGEIEINHVSFGYDEKEVLHDFSLEVKNGEQVTLIGKTGAGKSTIFRLLLGLYSPKEGEIKLGGKYVSEISDRERRKTIGCVEQHFSRIDGNILDQITLGDPSISEEMAIDAAKLVGIHDSIMALPEGYQNECNEHIFSQGEWQLLSIARAIVANPKILLLDEITANLDARTEERVLEAIKSASEGRTLLSISHRIYETLGTRSVEIKQNC